MGTQRDSFPHVSCKSLFPFLELVIAACAAHDSAVTINHNREVNLGQLESTAGNIYLLRSYCGLSEPGTYKSF